MLWALRSILGWAVGAWLAYQGAKVAWSALRWALGRPDALGWLWDEIVATCERIGLAFRRIELRISRRELTFDAYRKVGATLGGFLRSNPDYIRAVDAEHYVSVRRLRDGIGGAVLVVHCPSNTAAIVNTFVDWRDAVDIAPALTLIVE
jgi:hypothetical protein